MRLYVLNYSAKSNTVALPNQTLKDSLLEYLNEYKMLTDWLEIEDGKIKSVAFFSIIMMSEGFKISERYHWFHECKYP